MKISQLRKNSNSFVRDLDRIIERVVNFNEDLEQLNKDQLKKGKLSNDRTMAPYKKGYYYWKKRAYPSSVTAGTKVNLFLTGDLFNNMDLIMRGGKYFIDSTVPYVPNLIRKYSDKIFGIAPSNQDKAKQITTALLAEQYKLKVLS